MIYTADYLIEKRKAKWDELHSIEADKKLREAISNELVINKKLREDVQKSPEKLIELLFVVVDKEQKTVPFFLNDVQTDFVNRINQAKVDYEAGKITDISLLVLKGRQQGFTTLITAYQLASILVNKNFQGFTVADTADNSEMIFQNKAKFTYEQLPEQVKPTEKFNNRRQLLFEKLNSSWSVDTATKNMGRSRTINFFHGSECAFWRDGIASTQAGLGEAFTKNCIKIYETTANGYNEYRTMWYSGQHINCFYEWWRTSEYRLKFESERIKKEFIHDIQTRTDWIFSRLKWLQDTKHLDLEQLYWYYKKYMSYIDKELIKQEYPCFVEEAFLSTGACMFDKEAVVNRIQEVPSPIKTGYFIYDYNGLKITNIRWVNDANGYIKIFKTPEADRPYVIGGDTAGDGSDFFTGHVLDNITGEQVAVLQHQFDEDLYARQMYCLGIYYNRALIGIETNYSTFPIKEIARLGYPKLYVRQKEDEYTHRVEKKFGFETTKVTRPVILADLVQIVRETAHLINDKTTLEEMLTFVKNDNGTRYEAQHGCHDDNVMGLAIAHYIRPQQSMKIKKPDLKQEFYNFDIEKPLHKVDIGEKITII